MPTYEYQCQECGFKFEEFQSIVSEPIRVCPKCNGKVERLINGGIGLIFKGSGFYLTDYKNKRVPQQSETAARAQSNGKDSTAKATDKK